MNTGTPTLGVIIGNRDFFPDHLEPENPRRYTETLRRTWGQGGDGFAGTNMLHNCYCCILFACG